MKWCFGNKKRVVGTLVSMLLLISVFHDVIATEENLDYAEIIFGETVQEYNAGLRDNEFVVRTVNGKTGLQSVMQEAWGLDIDIDDTFMYDLSAETPVNIVVEYYDEGAGTFSLQYDSHNPWKKLQGYYENNIVWNVAELVQLNDTKEWRTHTFRLTDLRAANRSTDGTDFRIQVYNPHNHTSKYSRSDVLFGSVKIEYGEWESNITLESLSSAYVGNVFSADEEIVLNAEFANRADGVSVTGNIIYSVYDEEESLVCESAEPIKIEIEVDKKQSYDIRFANPGKNGIYRIDIEIENSLGGSAELLDNYLYSRYFGVAEEAEGGRKNSGLGTTVQMGPKRRGDVEDVIEICKKAGISYVRDDNPNTTVTDGKHTIDTRCMEIYKQLKENNIEPFLILKAPAGGGTSWSWNKPPHTKEQLEEWGEYCYDMALQLKGIVSHFEIWNEYNTATSNAIQDVATPENYTEMLKYAYTNIKKANTETKIYGVCSAPARNEDCGYEPSLVKGVFESGGLEYMDFFSYHPYDWSGEFREDRFIKDAQKLKALMRENGREVPIFISEFGFSTNEAHPAISDSYHYTLEQQYQSTVMAYAINKSYGIADTILFYCLYNMELKSETEDNWGWLNYWAAKDGNANTPKPVYIAMMAYNKMIGNSEADGIINKDRAYALKYKNSEMDKDVMLLINGEGIKEMNISLGVSAVEVYDSYGNKKEDVLSSDGIYNFVVTKEPVYVVGNFSDFKEAVKPVELSVESERAGQLGNNEWRIKAIVKNNTADIQSGKITISEPAEIADMNTAHEFADLYPGETVTRYFDLLDIVEGRTINVLAKATFESGYANEIIETLKFKGAGIEYDFSEYGTDIEPDGISGIISETGSVKALRIGEKTTKLTTGFTEGGKYEIIFSIYPENRDDQYVICFDGAVPYMNSSGKEMSSNYRIIGFSPQAGNTAIKSMYGWDAEYNAWAFGYGSERIATNYKSQWYDVRVLIDCENRTAVVTIDANESGESWTRTITMPDGVYPKSLNIYNVDMNGDFADNALYIGKISVKRYEEYDISAEYKDGGVSITVKDKTLNGKKLMLHNVTYNSDGSIKKTNTVETVWQDNFALFNVEYEADITDEIKLMLWDEKHRPVTETYRIQ